MHECSTVRTSIDNIISGIEHRLTPLRFEDLSGSSSRANPGASWAIRQADNKSKSIRRRSREGENADIAAVD